jgi:signal peptide peptidase SppA
MKRTPQRPYTAERFADHLGPWAIDAQWFSGAVDAIRSGLIQPGTAIEGFERVPLLAFDDDDDRPAPAARPEDLALTHDGIGIVQLLGPLQKGDSSFGGSSTVRARRSIREASRNPDVKAILLVLDSPGGEAAGTNELALDVEAAAAVKPLFAHIQDLGASAAYYVASQARQISVNETGQVGSIGTVAMLIDSSGAFAMEGLKVHVVATGPFKGAFAPGSPITDEQLAEISRRVEGFNAFFLAAVQRGRELSSEQLAAVADGRIWIAAEAHSLRLVDVVQSLDETLAQLRREMAGDSVTGADAPERTLMKTQTGLRAGNGSPTKATAAPTHASTTPIAPLLESSLTAPPPAPVPSAGPAPTAPAPAIAPVGADFIDRASRAADRAERAAMAAEQEELRARSRRITGEVEQRLLRSGGVTPAMLRTGLVDALVVLASSAAPPTVQVATQAGQPPVERPVHEVLLAALEQVPSLSLGGILAGPGTGELLAQDRRGPAEVAIDSRNGIKAERHLELVQRYPQAYAAHGIK